MKYLSKYDKFNELFGIFKKDKNNDWKSKLEWIFNNYKKEDFVTLNAEIEKSASGGEVLSINWVREGDWNNHYNIFSGEKSKDGLNRLATDGDYEEWPVISDKDYNRYKEKIQEISDYLDEKEHISSSSVGIGEIDLKIDELDIAKMDIDEKIKKYFKDDLNKEYKFESEYYEWSGPSSNEKKIEDIKVMIYDISGDIRPGGRGGIQDFYLMVKCKLGDRKMKFMVDEMSLTEYRPISEIPRNERYDLTLKLYQDDEGLSRVELRKLKNHGYPHVINYNMVPCDWNSIEFIKKCNDVIKIAMGKM